MSGQQMEKIIRAGCFEGRKEDPKALCQKTACGLRRDCLWTKPPEEVPNGLGVESTVIDGMPRRRGV